MVFSNPIFIFGFLPAFLAAYYAVPARMRSGVILLGSYAFYGWWRVDYLALIFGLSLASYFAARVALEGPSERIRRNAVRLGVGFDLLVLGYFKYTMFFMGGLSDLSEALGGGSVVVPAIILPIGISFHTFQSISYIIDVARKDAPPARSLVDFLAFGALFPQLIAGPVLRYKDLADQFLNRTHTVAKFAKGVQRFCLGLAMKVLVADSVAPLADAVFAASGPTLVEAWLGTAAYSVQLLFDFAGYSAMAIGLGLMIGFRFPENFNHPYTSRSITEFWQRWHMSLSLWLRDYLYIPLGGNRRGTARTYLNLWLTMVLGGLWHGANWTFVLWGVWHGTWLAIERAAGRNALWPRAFAWPVTLVIVMIGWVLFRAPSVADAITVYHGMIGLNGLGLGPELAWQIPPASVFALSVGAALSLFGLRLKAFVRSLLGSPAVQFGTTSALFVAAVLMRSAQTHSPFLYFQF